MLAAFKGREDELFRDFQKNIHLALLLHNLNSGMMLFGEYREFDRAYVGREIEAASVIRQVREEQMTPEVVAARSREFCGNHSYASAKMGCCGSCGIRHYERKAGPTIKFFRLDLSSDKARLLRYTKEQKEELEQLRCNAKVSIPVACDSHIAGFQFRMVDTSKAISVYEGTTGLFHLHPELCHIDKTGREYTHVCHGCDASLGQGEILALSIANGIDFGSLH